MGRENRQLERKERLHRRKERRRLKTELREKAAGLVPPVSRTSSNRKSPHQTVEEEQAARTEAVVSQAAVIRGQLPLLLRRFAKIPDPRDPRKIRHKHTVLLVYGVLMFVYQMASRRETNRTVTQPAFQEQLQNLFPELESMPHGDTLYRFLARIDATQLAEIHLEMVRHLIRSKKFQRYLVGKCYPISIDGTQKVKFDELWAEECLERTVGSGDKARPQYYAYVLEASLTFRDGLTIPLMSEFLSYEDGDPTSQKQDCELKAFRRLAKRLKAAFPRLPVILFLDGLYPNGPAMALCREHHWAFMMVLQDGSLPSVWAEFNGLKDLEQDNVCKMNWGNRAQCFRWVNQIEYRYGDHERKRIVIHLVVCEEAWWDIDKSTNQPVKVHSRHAWVSSDPLNRKNVHERCNLGARRRWGIEAGFLVEKHHGYHYEHRFAWNWNVMKSYHILMHLARLLNVLWEYSERVGKMVQEMGLAALYSLVKQTLGGRWLDLAAVRQRLSQPCQLRLE